MASAMHTGPSSGVATGEDNTPRIHTIEGTIQSVNYPAGRLTVVCKGKQWPFVLSQQCQLWFNGRIACTVPLFSATRSCQGFAYEEPVGLHCRGNVPLGG
jgi:hypothetical protein